MLDQLLQFPRIGWDFDGTLCRHPKSWMMHEFIRANPQIEHHIVTFRSHGWQYNVFDELHEFYPDPPRYDEFKSVLNIADDKYSLWLTDNDRRSFGGMTGELTANETFYHMWKGETCKHHGIPVLVDDDTPRVIRGCNTHGIRHIHPDQL